jgi:hypothetical protein
MKCMESRSKINESGQPLWSPRTLINQTLPKPAGIVGRGRRKASTQMYELQVAGVVVIAAVIRAQQNKGTEASALFFGFFWRMHAFVQKFIFKEW